MSYLYSRNVPPPRRAGISAPPRNPFVQQPPRLTAASRLPARASATARLRVENSGTNLGVLPLVAAAVPSVTDLAKKALSSVVGIVDPGKKREANREARAEMYFQLALQGSITAARRLHGGTHFQYTANEKKYYLDRWSKFQAALPDLAKQALAAGDLGIPEPGSDTTPPQLSEADQQTIQNEINVYHGVASPNPSKTPLQSGFGGNVGMLLALGIAGAFLARKL